MFEALLEGIRKQEAPAPMGKTVSHDDDDIEMNDAHDEEDEEEEEEEDDIDELDEGHSESDHSESDLVDTWA